MCLVHKIRIKNKRQQPAIGTTTAMVQLKDFLFDNAVGCILRLYVVAVTVAVVAPRMPLDKPWTIGGNLSNGFRKLVLVISFVYIT